MLNIICRRRGGFCNLCITKGTDDKKKNSEQTRHRPKVRDFNLSFCITKGTDNLKMIKGAGKVNVTVDR